MMNLFADTPIICNFVFKFNQEFPLYRLIHLTMYKGTNKIKRNRVKV